MPLMPDLEWDTDLAVSSAAFNASGVEMSGLLAPLRTASPMPELAMSTRLPATTMPFLLRSSIDSAVRMTRSAAAPASSSFTRLAVAPQVMAGFAPPLRSNAGMRSSSSVFTPLVQIAFIAALLSLLGLDHHAIVLDEGLVGLDRHHAGRRHHLAGLDVELPVVEVALDYVALDEALRQEAGAVGTLVVGDKELAAEVEHRERQALCLDPQWRAGGNLGSAAESDTGHAGKLLVDGRQSCFH